MSELFDEVDEEVRREQLKKLWERYSIYIIAGAILIVATVGGWFAVEILGWGLPGVFTAIAVGMICFGGLIAGPLVLRPWRARRVKLFPKPGGSDAASLDDPNLEPQPR